MKRPVIALSVFLIVILLVVCLISCGVRASGSSWFLSGDDKRTFQVAIVPGAGVWGKWRLSHVLEDRVLTAIDLYRRKRVRKLLFSGRHDTTGYDEVNAMRRYAVARGIPPRDIFLDHAGFTTYQTMYRAAAVFRVSDCLVVTQRFHLYRALYIGRRLGLRAWGVVCDRRRYVRGGWYEFRDFFSRVKAWLQAGLFRPLPKYLGKVHPVSGDGRSTHDQL